MSRRLYRPGPPAEGRQKIFVATPAYRDVGSNFAYALAQSMAALERAEIPHELEIFTGNCHVDDSRNSLVRTFLQSDCTDLVFLDADLRWEPDDLLGLIAYEADIVGASYPLKQPDEVFPVQYLDDGPLQASPQGLIEVAGLPTGFLRIRRHVLKAMAEATPYFHVKDDKGLVPLIFQRQLDGNLRIGGDYGFCRQARHLGYRIWAAPEIWLEHSGEHEWTGSLGAHLRRINGIGITAALSAIRNGTETPATFMELVRIWGNPWAADSDFLSAAALLAREARGPILECGSGLTTLVMAAANPDVPIWALEHDPLWAGRVGNEARAHAFENVRLHCAPLRDGWYVPPQDMPREFALVLCDGPPRELGHRAALLRAEFTADRYLFDDLGSADVKEAVKWLCERDGMTAHRLGGPRPFAILSRPASEKAA